MPLPLPGLACRIALPSAFRQGCIAAARRQARVESQRRILDLPPDTRGGRGTTCRSGRRGRTRRPWPGCPAIHQDGYASERTKNRRARLGIRLAVTTAFTPPRASAHTRVDCHNTRGGGKRWHLRSFAASPNRVSSWSSVGALPYLMWMALEYINTYPKAWHDAPNAADMHGRFSAK